MNLADYPLANSEALLKFLNRHGMGPNKSLGQHFLCSPVVVHQIVESAKDAHGVLEIGPGPGVLTGPLSIRAEMMVALELDGRMVGLLAKSAPKAKVIAQDALKADLVKILEDLPTPRAIVSNLPYYITGPLIARIADVREHISVAVLMMQREVADRIRAEPGNSDRGALSIALQEQFDISVVCQVPARAFMPPPKVESTVLRFIPKPPTEGAEALLKFVRHGFSQPRKTLVNNLMGAGISKVRTVEVLGQLEIDDRIRPHALTTDQWKALYRAFYSE